MSCVAPGCRTGYGTKSKYPPGVGAHRFPKDPRMRRLWIEAIPRENWEPSPSARICSLHFSADDYVDKRSDKNFRRLEMSGELRRLILKPHAIPHIFTAIKKVTDNNACVVPGCKSGKNPTGRYPRGVSKYSFPQNRELRRKWMAAIGRDNWEPSEDSVICSLHFDDQDYHPDENIDNESENEDGDDGRMEPQIDIVEAELVNIQDPLGEPKVQEEPCEDPEPKPGCSKTVKPNVKSETQASDPSEINDEDGCDGHEEVDGDGHEEVEAVSHTGHNIKITKLESVGDIQEAPTQPEGGESAAPGPDAVATGAPPKKRRRIFVVKDPRLLPYLEQLQKGGGLKNPASAPGVRMVKLAPGEVLKIPGLSTSADIKSNIQLLKTPTDNQSISKIPIPSNIFPCLVCGKTFHRDAAQKRHFSQIHEFGMQDMSKEDNQRGSTKSSTDEKDESDDGEESELVDLTKDEENSKDGSGHVEDEENKKKKEKSKDGSEVVDLSDDELEMEVVQVLEKEEDKNEKEKEKIEKEESDKNKDKPEQVETDKQESSTSKQVETDKQESSTLKQVETDKQDTSSPKQVKTDKQDTSIPKQVQTDKQADESDKENRVASRSIGIQCELMPVMPPWVQPWSRNVTVPTVGKGRCRACGQSVPDDPYMCDSCETSLEHENKTIQLPFTSNMLGLHHGMEARQLVLLNVVPDNGQGVFQCQHCGSRFATQRGLTTHVSNVHFKSPSTPVVKMPPPAHIYINIADDGQLNKRRALTANQRKEEFSAEKIYQMHADSLQALGKERGSEIVAKSSLNNLGDRMKKSILEKAMQLANIIPPQLPQETNPVDKPVEPDHPKLFSCDTCKTSFSMELGLYRHIYESHPDAIIKCKKCKDEFKYIRDYKSHMSAFHAKKTIPVAHRGYNLRTEIKKPEHHEFEEPTKPNIPCENCGKKFRKSFMLKQHVKKKHNGLGFRCHVCQKQIRNEKVFRKHVKRCEANLLLEDEATDEQSTDKTSTPQTAKKSGQKKIVKTAKVDSATKDEKAKDGRAKKDKTKDGEKEPDWNKILEYFKENEDVAEEGPSKSAANT